MASPELRVVSPEFAEIYIGEFADRDAAQGAAIDHSVRTGAPLFATGILPDGMNPCGKKWYLSQEEAEYEMGRMHSIRGPQFRLNAYYCYDCDGFHLGHTRVSPQRRRGTEKNFV